MSRSLSFRSIRLIADGADGRMFESAFDMTRTPRPHSCISRCMNVTSLACLGNTPRPGPRKTPNTGICRRSAESVLVEAGTATTATHGQPAGWGGRALHRRREFPTGCCHAATGTVDCGNSEGRRGATAAAGTKVLGRLEPVGLPPARLADGTEAPHLYKASHPLLWISQHFGGISSLRRQSAKEMCVVLRPRPGSGVM